MRLSAIVLALSTALLADGCAFAYYLHAKEQKLIREAAHDTGCADVEILEQGDTQARVRACGAVWQCSWRQDFAPTGPLSTDHGHWKCL